MSRTPQPPSISDAGYRLLFMTCRRKDLFSLLSKPCFIIVLFSHDWCLFCRWIPDNVSVSLVSVPPVGQSSVRVQTIDLQRSLCSFMTQAATALSNSTAIQHVFKRTAETVSLLLSYTAVLLNRTKFTAMFKRRAFLHWWSPISVWWHSVLYNLSQVYRRRHGCDGILRGRK
jgi:hypothetical protein